MLSKKIPLEFVWLSIDDTQKEGEWRDYYTQHILNYTLPWFKNEPNGTESENCALLASWASLRWSDFHCATFAGCLCDRLEPLPRLKLQGLCLSSTLGKYFSPMNNLTNFASLTFVSMRGSSFEYDAESRRWKLIVPHSNVRGISKAAHRTFALGKHNWTITGDVDCTRV